MKVFKLLVFSTLALFVIMQCSSQLKKEVVEYFDNGSPKCENFYTLRGDKKEVVKEIQFFENGHKKLVGHYKSGKKDGKWTYWYINGKKQSEGYFIQNIKTGETTVFHENGKLFYKGQYTEGQKDGVWVFYNDQGKEVNRIVFKMGKVEKQLKQRKAEKKK